MSSSERSRGAATFCAMTRCLKKFKFSVLYKRDVVLALLNGLHTSYEHIGYICSHCTIEIRGCAPLV